MASSRSTPHESVHESNSSDAGRDPILELRDARVSFDMERGRSRVLDDVDLDVYRGQVLGIVGESGSGKSMLASAMLNAVVDPGSLSGDVMYRPDSGEPVNVADLEEDALKDLRWSEISMVFQGALSSFNPTMDVRSHFQETLDAHDADRAAGMDRARQLLSELYLDPERVLDSYPHELSGGMKQRALIALSLVLEPNVLVLDEPTAALDLLMQRSILSLLDQLQREYDLTMVFITHDLPLVTDLADRLGVMYAFDIVEVLDKSRMDENIVDRAKHPYTRALVNSTPNLEMPLSEMQAIEGSSPDPVNRPGGCAYHPRCPLADERCTQEDPPMHDVNGHHEVACFYWEDVEEEVPMNVMEGER